MKKLLSIVLCLAMVATLFTGTFAMTANAAQIEVVKPLQSASDSYVFADYTTTEEGYRTVSNSDNLGYVLDMARLDANTKYRIRMTANTVRDDEATAVSAWVYSNVIVDGVYGKRSWDNGEIRVTANPAELTAESSQYLSLDTLSIYGNKVELQICPRKITGGTLNIEKLELVPDVDTTANGGYVLSTGYDEERGTTIYTAYAKEGFAVGAITAMSQFRSTTAGRDYQYMACGVEVINKVSSSEVQFVVDITDTGDAGDYNHNVIYGRGFISANFFEKVKPAQAPSQSLTIYEFNQSNSPSGTGNSWDAEKGAFKFDIDDKYAASASGEKALDINVSIPANKLDASTNYKIRLNYEATEGFTMWTYFHVYADGSQINRGIHNGEARLASGHADVSGTTSLDSIDSISVYGSTMSMWLRMRVTAANAAAMATSGREDNAIWLKSIELVPAENNSKSNGYTLVTNYDSDNGRAVFTAYPDEGYKVYSVSATVYNASNTPTIITSVVELEKGEDYYTFSIDRTIPDSDGKLYTKMLQVGDYINVTFVEKDIVPMRSPSESYKVYEADDEVALGAGVLDADETIDGTGYSLRFDNANMTYSGGIYSSDFNIVLDAADIAHFDANNRYYVRAAVKSTSDWDGYVYINPACTIDGTSHQLRRSYYNGDMYLVGNVQNKVTACPDEDWSIFQSETTIAVVGSQVRLQLCIRDYSDLDDQSLWIDYVELVPANDNTEAHGVVVTETDADTGKTLVTAIADEGYQLDSISITPYIGVKSEECKDYPVNDYDKYPLALTATAHPTVESITYSFDFSEITTNTGAGYGIIDNGTQYFVRATFKVAEQTLAGDANADGAVNVKDLIRTKSYLAGANYEIDILNVDTESDREVNTADLAALRKQLLGF